MEVKEKREALIAWCDKQNDCEECGFYAHEKEMCATDFYNAPNEMIEKWYMTVFPEPIIKDSGVRTSALNYEAEYNRLREENAKLQEEIKYMQIGARELREERNRMEAKLEMVYLIFGGRNGR